MTAARITTVWLLAALALVGGAATVHAQKATATEHLVRGSKLYDQGHYDEAIAELKAGYAIEPRPDFFYALGQAERKRGNCKAAIGWYQRYVDSGPSAQRTVATLVQIDRCKQEMASAPPGTTAPPQQQPHVERPPAVVEPQPSAPPTTATSEPPPAAAAPARDATPRPSTPIYKRWWLWTAVAVVVVGGVGAGVAVALTQRSTFSSTLPDLTWGTSALGVRF